MKVRGGGALEQGSPGTDHPYLCPAMQLGEISPKL